MNERFSKIRSLSPLNKRPDSAIAKIKEVAPTYEANLFKQPAQQTKNKSFASYSQREKPLMILRVDLGQRAGGFQVVQIFKDDINASLIAERVLKMSSAHNILSKQLYRQTASLLAAHLEKEINKQIKLMLEERHRQIMDEHKIKNQIDQLERERRIL